MEIRENEINTRTVFENSPICSFLYDHIWTTTSTINAKYRIENNAFWFSETFKQNKNVIKEDIQVFYINLIAVISKLNIQNVDNYILLLDLTNSYEQRYFK